MGKKTARPSVAAIRRRTLEMGALDAKIVHPKNVVTADWVRMKCQYGCDGYASSLTCPPHSPTPAQTRRVLDCYRRALLVHGDATVEIRGIMVPLEREAFLAGFYKAFAFSCGPCNLCATCAFEKGCRHAGEARPAMEASGIDVYATAHAAGLPIEVVTGPKCAQNYYGLLLLD